MTFNQDKCKVLHLERKNVWNDIGWRLTEWGKAVEKSFIGADYNTSNLSLDYSLHLDKKENPKLSEDF